jgi:hypothetical protein
MSAFCYLDREILNHPTFINYPLTDQQHKFKDEVVRWLDDLGWPDDHIVAYMVAQRTHGILAPHVPSWTVRAALASWKVDRPVKAITHSLAQSVAGD